MTADAVSSFVIVAVADPCAILAFAGFESVTVNVSFPSTLVSPATVTGIVFSVSPGRNVSVPLAGV